jgi:glutamate-5-semialdehyde dehydrogenase
MENTESFDANIRDMAKAAKQAARKLGKCPTDVKNAVLLDIAAGLQEQAGFIKQENQRDVARAREMGLSDAMIDRLTITDTTIQSMVAGLKEVVQLGDPVGSSGQSRQRPNGLQVSRMRIPLGVIGIIYESRPNVTVDAAGLCLKAGNADILRGGAEALDSNRALADILAGALKKAGLPAEAVQVIPVRE